MSANSGAESGMIARISQMEARLNRATAWLDSLEQFLSALGAAREDMDMLAAYLGSEDWRADRAADEAGLLPPALRRGVLSEDGIFNLLERSAELREEMRALLKE